MENDTFVGQRFGRLTSVSFDHRKRVKRGTVLYYRFICDCGSEKILPKNRVKIGHTRSCGCLGKENLKELAGKSTLKHGYGRRGSNRKSAYRSWAAMMSRCYNQKQPSYRYYGYRGIKVCDRWHSFALFLKDMGNPPEGYTLDRINPDKDYSPENCRWASHKTQSANTRLNKKIEINGTVKTLKEWCIYYDKHPKNVLERAAYFKCPYDKALEIEGDGNILFLYKEIA